MNKVSAINAATIIGSGALGCSWLWYLSSLCSNRGLVNMDPNTMIFDLVVVGVVSCLIFAINVDVAISAWGGWLSGQIILLVWDGMPRGRSPQMFQPTNFGEAVILALLVVVVLNWATLPGAILGYLLRYLFRQNRGKTSNEIK
jgi:hypothetical protein